MRKLRSDITVDEFFQWATKVLNGTPWAAMRDLVAQKPCDDYPDSFYEDPPPGSFGVFGFDNDDYSAWGYLDKIEAAQDHSYHKKYGGWFENFTPCLPTNVDENGWPKEKA